MKNYLSFTLAILLSLSSFAQYPLNWAVSMGGAQSDQITASASDAQDNIVSTGFFYGSVDFDPGAGTFNLTAFGSGDIFVQKLDPNGNFLWAVQLGGVNFDQGNDIVCDAAGNIYVTGSFQDMADFDPGSGVFPLNAGAAFTNEAFVVKLDPSGNLVWARQLGGPASSDEGKGIALDGSGNVITAGVFNSTGDFDPGAGTFSMTPAFYDIYISKLDNAGNFVFALKMGGPGIEMPFDLATDGSGNILTTGYYQNGADFDPGAGSYVLNSNGGTDIFVSKLSAGGSFVYAAGIGSTANDKGYAIYSDNTGNAFVAGNFQGTADFDPGAGVYNLSSAGGQDAFFLKLDPAGNMQFAVNVGGPMSDRGTAISLDLNGNVLCAGDFMGTGDFDPGAGTFNLSSNGLTDIYFLMLDNSGNFSSAFGIGDSLDDAPYAAFVNSNNRLHLAGYFSASPDFDPGAGSFVMTSNGSSDAFVMQFNNCSPVHSKATAVGCDSFVSYSGQHVWYESGLYYDTLAAADGCDSIVALTLTISHSSVDTVHVYACDSFPVELNDTAFTIYHDTMLEKALLNQYKCDSIIRYMIHIGQTAYLEIDTAIYCDVYTSPGGQVLTHSGVYHDTLPGGSQSCDSIFVIHLEILQGDTSYIKTTACERFVSPDGQLIEDDSTFAVIYRDPHGCDSVIIYSVHILHASYDTLDITACDSFTSPGGGVYTQPGSYQFNDTLVNASGCDSILVIHLTLHHSYVSKPLSVKSCGTYISPGGQSWDHSGSYADTFEAGSGCDSIVMYNVTILPVSHDTVSVSACDSYLTPSGLLITHSGYYADPDTLTAANGCDSILIWDVEITPTPQAQITLYGDTMIATPQGADYQWLDCKNGMKPIEGATGPLFISGKPGCYAVEVTVNGCVDTSECECFTGIGTLLSRQEEALRIYPNPSDGSFRVETKQGRIEAGSLRVLDISGREVDAEIEVKGDNARVHINAKAGVYFIYLLSDGRLSGQRIVIQ